MPGELKNPAESTVGIVVRQGASGDRDWVLALLEEGVRDRHFAQPILLNARNALGAILAGAPYQMMRVRDDALRTSSVTGVLTVAEINGTPAAFLIVVRDTDGMELHLAATQKTCRRRGAFSALLKDAIEHNHAGVPMIARCYKRSTWAMAALTSLGFKMTKDGDPKEFAI